VSDHADPDLAGVLAKVASSLPNGGEDRPGQLAMAGAVERSIAEHRHLIVQAGTGTGKSLAYLLPLVRSGAKTVVATATKALQDQLAHTELPFLVSELASKNEFTYAVLKGRSNYLCRQRAAEVSGTAEGTATFDDVMGEAAHGPAGSGGTAGSGGGGFADQVRRLLAWAEESSSGDRSELDFEPHPRAWAALSVGPRECPGAFRCPSGSVCFAERARALAAAADVVVVNTHLYATHLASGGSVLPDHEMLVLDEAHAVEDIFTAGLGVEIGAGRLRAVALAARALLARDEAGPSDALVEAAEQLDGVLRRLLGKRVLRRRSESWTGEENEEAGPPRNAGIGAEAELEADLHRVIVLARSRLEVLAGALRRSADEEEDDGGRLARVLLAVGHLLGDLSAIETSGEDHVAWVESDDSSGRAVRLRLAPIEVGPLLAERLWPQVTAVLTSATVPPRLPATLGLPDDTTDQADVGSPFPFSRCALLYCPTDLPDRRSPEAEEAVHEELLRIILAAGGRTLALFTSWRAMHAAVEALRSRLDVSVLAQNDLPKPKLVASFREEESACLFAPM
jgi:ATP-dependent DNA helicase DinG